MSPRRPRVIIICDVAPLLRLVYLLQDPGLKTAWMDERELARESMCSVLMSKVKMCMLCAVWVDVRAYQTTCVRVVRAAEQVTYGGNFTT